MKAVTLDMWNTLIRDKHYGNLRVRCLARALTELGIPRSYNEIREAYLSTHDFVHGIWRDEDYRFVPVDERLSHILEILAADLTEDLRQRVLKDFEEYALTDPPALAEGAHTTLRSLSPRVKLGVICDSGYTPGRILRRVLAGHRVLKFFQVTVFSDETGVNKPHGTMFEKALSSLDVEPSESVHVGDTFVTDIVGAKAAGMKAIWLNRNGQPNIGSYKPDFDTRALPEVTRVLNKIG